MCICSSFRTPVEGVNVYARPEAGDFRQLKMFLENRGVVYRHKDTSQDADDLAHMQSVSGQQEEVVVEIGKKIFVGFKQAELEHVLP